MKLFKLKTPLLNDLAIDPFIHTNIAFAPNKNIIDQNGFSPKNFIRDYARASLGFGCAMQLSWGALEFYYNPLVYRQKNELKSEFQINFGID